MRYFTIPIFLFLAYPLSCSAKPPVPKAVTYDQVQVDETTDVDLSTGIDVHDSTRISVTREKYFCANQTMEIELSQRFENRARIGVTVNVFLNGKKLDRETVSKVSKNIEDYRFYDFTFSCFNGAFGARITGYKIGLNGARPSDDVFHYQVILETGETIK